MKISFTKNITILKSLQEGDTFTENKELFEVRTEYSENPRGINRMIVISKKTNQIYHIFNRNDLPGGGKLFNLNG